MRPDSWPRTNKVWGGTKLYGDDSSGVVDTPAKLLSLKDVAAAGLFPKLHDKTHVKACLNPPESDFVLGDDTLAPTPGPPPDCGNGWWNYSINNCTYWVPPPTEPPAPINLTALNITLPSCPEEGGSSALQAGGIGVIVGVVVAFIGGKLFGNNRRQGYSEIPN